MSDVDSIRLGCTKELATSNTETTRVVVNQFLCTEKEWSTGAITLRVTNPVSAQ